MNLKRLSNILSTAIFILCCSQTQLAIAQEPGTLKIRKESNIIKAYFDPTELRLIAIDRFGNPQENRIVGFKLFVKAKRSTNGFEAFSGTLTPDMIAYLNNLKTASKIFFTEVMAKDENNALLKLPDVIEVWFPNPGSQNQNKKKSRN